MALGHISQIIQNRSGWQVLCRGGVQSTSWIYFKSRSHNFSRCNAPPDNLDRPNSRRRTHEKTDLYVSAWDSGTLWTDFGIRADIVVSSLRYHFDVVF